MRGDIILVEEHHRAAAVRIVDHLQDGIGASELPFVITVAGESGSGKSETGRAIHDELASRGIRSFVFQQDDYFVLPPRSNDRRRRDDISWVGTGEVRLDLLDSHLAAVRSGQVRIEKPLVEYEEDRITTETVDVSGCSVLIAEGTYTTLLANADARVFIARNRLETLESRKKRAREAMDPFIEQVLEIEHAIIAPHREKADVVLSRDYEVKFRAP